MSVDLPQILIGVVSQMLKLLDDPAGFVRQDGRILVVNAGKAESLRMTQKALIGLHINDFLRHIPGADPWSDLCANAGQDGAFHTTLVTDAVSVEVVLKPMRYAAGVEGYLCQTTSGIKAKDKRMQFFLENLDQGVWEYDVADDEFEVTGTWRKMRGMAANEPLRPPDENWLDEIHPNDRKHLSEALEQQHAGLVETINVQYRRLHRDGHYFWVLCRGKTIERFEDGTAKRVLGSDIDITHLKQAEAELSQLASKMQLAITSAEMGIWEFDPVTQKVFWDDRMLEMYGITDGNNDRSGQDWEAFLHPSDLAEVLAYSDWCEEHDLDFKLDYRIIREDGEVRHVRSMARQIVTEQGSPLLIGTNLDVTADYQRTAELEQARAQLEYESRHDALTGLANRRLLDETVEDLYSHMRYDTTYAVLHLDLDNLKPVNDTYGHAAGDAVLTEASLRLRQMICPSALIARVGGDEFVILYPRSPSVDELERIAQKIVEAMHEPVKIGGMTCHFGVSVGVALGIGVPDNHSETFINADLALYEAKKSGRSCYRFFDLDTMAQSDVRIQ